MIACRRYDRNHDVVLDVLTALLAVPESAEGALATADLTPGARSLFVEKTGSSLRCGLGELREPVTKGSLWSQRFTSVHVSCLPGHAREADTCWFLTGLPEVIVVPLLVLPARICEFLKSTIDQGPNSLLGPHWSVHLGFLTLYCCLRAHVSGVGSLQRGWVAGLADEPVGRALEIMHRFPSRGWTVSALSAELGMDRSRFANRFTAVTGLSPIKYLTLWRMHVAEADILAKEPVGRVASKLGYRDQGLFSDAFTRVFGSPPTTYRRQHEHLGGSALR